MKTINNNTKTKINIAGPLAYLRVKVRATSNTRKEYIKHRNIGEKFYDRISTSRDRSEEEKYNIRLSEKTEKQSRLIIGKAPRYCFRSARTVSFSHENVDT